MDGFGHYFVRFWTVIQCVTVQNLSKLFELKFYQKRVIESYKLLLLYFWTNIYIYILIFFLYVYSKSYSSISYTFPIISCQVFVQKSVQICPNNTKVDSIWYLVLFLNLEIFVRIWTVTHCTTVQNLTTS
jgi:hypothetical protein